MKGSKNVRGRPRQKRNPRRQRRSKYEVAEQASLTEVLAVPTLNANAPYSDYNIQLSLCPRAVDVAKGYQFYRIKRVTYVIRPLTDTFNAQGLAPGGSQATVPYLYHMMDRTAQFAAGFDASFLRSLGAKAIRLDDKTITFSYTPNVLTQTLDKTVGANTAVQYKLMPWLPTHDTSVPGPWAPSTIDHLGHVWLVEQVAGDPIGYRLERRIQFEFKKPAIPLGVGALGAAPVDINGVGNSE